MSYDTSTRKKAKPAEQQALLPDALRQANVQIEGQLTKYQNNLRQLIQMKDEIGTDKDTNESQLRTRIHDKQREMNDQSKVLQKDIDDYGQISVPYRSQRQQQEKQEAYNRRLAECVNKYSKETQEIHIKMQQHLDLVKRRQTLMYNESSTSLHGDEENQQFLQQEQLDVDELRVQGEAAYMDDLIKQRQDELNNVEQFMTDINDIAKEINTKVHEQRTDLIEIDNNAGTALDNAKDAEKNIEEAQEHQKSGGKCMYWTVGILSIGAIIIILIVVLSLVK